MTDGLTPEAEAVLDKVAKLLALADRAGTPEEAATAASKAQLLMEKHSLSATALEKRSGESGKRMQEAVEGGFYRYQQDVWREVAKLNFCVHWVGRQRVEVKDIRRKNRRTRGRAATSRSTARARGSSTPCRPARSRS